MRILDIYSRYQIPQNLQNHMLQVAAVGKMITDNFQVSLNQDLIIQVLLLHDVGNILKFNLDDPSLLVPEDRKRLNELKQIQVDFRQKYGPDTDEATLMIMAELEMSPQAIELCHESRGNFLPNFIDEDNFEKKICFYADMRVGPKGLLSIKNRFTDLIVRYPTEENRLTGLWPLFQILEQQLQKKTSIDITRIDSTQVEHEASLLKELII